MPYIKQDDREQLKEFIPSTPGELNYVLHCMILEYLDDKGLNYTTFNEIIGVLECIKIELYRRIGGFYEDIKIKENGDLTLYDKIRTKYGLLTGPSKNDDSGGSSTP